MRQVQGATVVKLGGSLLEDAKMRGAALAAIAARFTAGEPLVVVHGGGLRIDRNLKALGIPKKTHQGLRVTDAETLDVVVSALAGVVNKSLVAEMEALGVSAAGISGADGGTLHAEFHPRLGGVDQRRDDDVERLGIGHAQALMRLLRDSERLEIPVDAQAPPRGRRRAVPPR